MLSKISVQKKKIYKRKKWKVKKKWRFWRLFKSQFLRHKKKYFFFKIKWIFNQKRILWHQLSVIYGKKIKNRAYRTSKSKVIFNSKFANILCKLELRLNILLLRTHFVNKILQADNLISRKKVVVNGVSKHKQYLVSEGDLVEVLVTHRKAKKKEREKNWKYWKWRKWVKNQLKKKKENPRMNFRKTFFGIKKNFIFNFTEINYYSSSFFLLRTPQLGEISYRNKRLFLVSNLLRKIYFVY